MNTTLLIMTVGGTDVKLAKENQLEEFAKSLHSTLWDRVQTNEWTLKDSPPAPSNTSPSKPLAELPCGPLVFCTPKLDAVLAYAKEKEEGLQIAAALLLDTRRPTTDPSYAGPVLARRIEQRLGIQARFGTYLTEKDEKLESKSDPRDALIRREVVTRIEQVVCEVLCVAKPQTILLAVESGFPDVRSLVPEIVRLHTNPSIHSVRVLGLPSGSLGDRAEQVLEPVHPDESFAARRRAIELVRKGHVLGAFGAVSHMHLEAEQKAWPEITAWTRVLEWLSRWACSLPLPPECDLSLLTYDRRGKRAVRSALQVELALRAGNIPSAVHGTVAFFESALLDHLDQRRTFVSSDDRSDWYRFDPQPDPSLVGKDSKGNLLPFQKKLVEKEDLYKTLEYEHRHATRILDEYLKQPKLQEFGKAISAIRKLRNDVAHNVPTPKKMEQAKKDMCKAKLWSSDTPPQFLKQQLVSAVLEELQVETPQNLCEELVSEVERRLLPRHPKNP
ncbi:MAG TPA: hypothetical protein PKE31_21070 [Pseudomonadota bacterium]|nr:hypothetical protein [Pseudomonadota bacterium]